MVAAAAPGLGHLGLGYLTQFFFTYGAKLMYVIKTQVIYEMN